MTRLTMRDYQTECIDAIWSAIEEGLQRFAVVLPTGSGKTVIFSNLVLQALSQGRRTLILVNRDELVRQTVRQLHGVDPGMDVGVIKAKENTIGRDVTVASVQTLGRMARLEQYGKLTFDFIIVDECHHAAAESYQRIIRYFGAFDDVIKFPGESRPDGRNFHPIVVGFTATLARQDSLGLGDVFQKVVYKKDIVWMVRRGYLVSPRGKLIHVNLDIADVKSSMGDLQAGSLGQALRDADVGPAIAYALRDHAADRQAIVFMPDVASAVQVAEDISRRVGMTTAVVTGTTPLEERRLIYKGVTAGEIQVLVNCMVLTEGFDLPQFSCAVIGRMTKSPGLFIQMVGRVLRPWLLHNESSPYDWMRKPKTDALVMMLDAAHGHSLATLVDLTETTVHLVKDGESLIEAIDREEEEFDTETSSIRREHITVTDIDLITQHSRFSFKKTPKGYLYIPTGDWLVTIYPEDDSNTSFMVGLIWCGKGPRQKGRTIASDMDFGYAMAQAEAIAEELEPVGTVSKKGASWKKRIEPASDKQLAFAASLAREGKMAPVLPSISKRDLSELLDSVVSSAAIDWYSPPPVVTCENCGGTGCSYCPQDEG
jgi:superfamily II DNA or RNA helicase